MKTQTILNIISRATSFLSTSFPGFLLSLLWEGRRETLGTRLSFMRAELFEAGLALNGNLSVFIPLIIGLALTLARVTGHKGIKVPN